MSPFGSATWDDVAAGLRDHAEARDALTASILEPGFEAVFWETSASSAFTRGRRYEQVVLDAPGLARVSPDRDAFAEHFHPHDPVVSFANLRGDARLVVPCPGTRDHPHLAAFLRRAPAAHVHALWSAVGRAVLDWWDRTDHPLWVSTAGMGVYWLHVRLDSRPKYYRHAPFRAPPAPRAG